MSPLTAWLGAFLFGQACEVPICAIALSHARPRPVIAARLAIAFGATALTHPVVWWLFPRLCLEPYWLMGLCAESFAVIVEAAWLLRFGLRGPARALLASLLANSASCGLGLLSRSLFGWP